MRVINLEAVSCEKVSKTLLRLQLHFKAILFVVLAFDI